MKSFKNYTQEQLDERVVGENNFINVMEEYAFVAKLARRLGNTKLIWRSAHEMESESLAMYTTTDTKDLDWWGRQFNKEITGDKVGAVMRILGVKKPVFVSANKERASKWGSGQRSVSAIVPVGNFTGYSSVYIDDIIIDVARIGQSSGMGSNSNIDTKGVHPKEIAASYKKKKNDIPRGTGTESFLEIKSQRYFLANIDKMIQYNYSKFAKLPKRVSTYNDLAVVLEEWIKWKSYQQKEMFTDDKIERKDGYTLRATSREGVARMWVTIIGKENTIYKFTATVTDKKQADKLIKEFKDQLKKEGLVK